MGPGLTSSGILHDHWAVFKANSALLFRYLEATAWQCFLVSGDEGRTCFPLKANYESAAVPRIGGFLKKCFVTNTAKEKMALLYLHRAFTFLLFKEHLQFGVTRYARLQITPPLPFHLVRRAMHKQMSLPLQDAFMRNLSAVDVLLFE